MADETTESRQRAGIDPAGHHVVLVFSEPTEGNEDAYNDWYDNVHLPEVLQVPGMVRAQRFLIRPKERLAAVEPPRRYLAIYEIAGEDPEAVLERSLKAAAEWMHLSDVIDRDNALSWIYSPIQDVVEPY